MVILKKQNILLKIIPVENLFVHKPGKLFVILAALGLFIALLARMATPASASSSYSALSSPTILSNDTQQDLATIRIDIPQTAVGTSSILLTLPAGFKIDWSVPANTPAVSVGKSGGGAFTAGFLAAVKAAGAADLNGDGVNENWNDGIIYVSDREFKVIYTAAAADYDVRLLVTLPQILVPDSADGDIKVTVDSLAGDFSPGYAAVGKTGSDIVEVYAGGAVIFTNSGTSAGQIKIFFKESSAGAVKTGNETIKLKLPKGLSWGSAGLERPDVINITTGAPCNLTADNDTDDRIIVINRAALVTDPKSVYEVLGTVKVDKNKAVPGKVSVTISGASYLSASYVIVGEYVDYSVKVIAKEEAKKVIAGRLAQEVAGFNIEEGAKGCIENNGLITMELPEGVKWASLTAGATGSLGGQGAITAVDSTGRKIKFTAANSGTSKGKYEFKNVKVDTAVDFTGDIRVKVDGTGINSQEVLVGKAIAPLTAAAATTEVKIGMQNQAGGVIKIAEGAKETLIKGKDLLITAPDEVEWFKEPTVEVTEGDLSIDTNGITENGRVLTIPIKSQSTTASTIEISDVLFTVDRTVPEGNITLEIGGSAIDEVNDPEKTLGPPKITRNLYTLPNNGLIFDGRDAAATVVNAITITPAPDETKPAGNVVFKIGNNRFTVGGVEQTMDAIPYIKDGRTFLPVKYAAIACGVSADNIHYSNGEVTLVKGNKAVQVTIGCEAMIINGNIIKMDVPAEISNDRVMLPCRWIAQALGAGVSYDGAARTVTLEL